MKIMQTLESLSHAIQKAGEATERFNQAASPLDELPRARKARFPIFRTRSRKRRRKVYRQITRGIARRMHELQGDYIQAFVRGEKVEAIELTQKSGKYLCEAVATFTILRTFESRFSGPREHVIRQLEAIRRKHKAGCAPFTGQSGHAAIRRSFLVRCESETARLDKLKSVAGAGFGIVV